MRDSIKGGKLPESEAEFKLLKDAKAVRHEHCILCKNTFSRDIVHSPRGWAETQISGFCEDCFDKLFEEPEEV